MKKTLGVLTGAVFIIATLLVLTLPREGSAIPSFARQVGQSCASCHWAFPKLNDVGINFKYNGYRSAPGEGENIWDWKIIPLSAMVEVEAMDNDDDWRTGGTAYKSEEQDMAVEEVELMLAAPIGERFSLFTEIEFNPDGDDYEMVGRLDYDITGDARAKVAAGHLDVDFPFLAHPRRIIHQSYLAHEIGFFPEETVGVELNGHGAGSGMIGHYTYNIGFLRDELTDAKDNLMASWYGTVSFNIQGHWIGLQYRTADEARVVTDEKTDRFAIAADIGVGPFRIIPAYFDASYEDFTAAGDLDADDLMLEILYKATDKLVLGLRADKLDAEQGSSDGEITDTAVNATYYIMPNVYLAAEYRDREYEDLDVTAEGDVSATGGFAAGDEKKEKRGRVFFVAAF